MTAEKLKKYQLLRLTEINRMVEMLDCATKARTDKDVQLVFRMRYPFLDMIKDEFFKNHNSVIALITTDDSQFDMEDGVRKQFEMQFYTVRAIYSGLFEVNADSTEPISSQPKPNISLPKLQLLTFSGDITTFTSYLDMFDAVIHTNSSLSNIEKFNYLISSLKGTPLSLVQKLPMTSDNYSIAYQTLVKRFKNQRLIAAAHWSAIENSPKLTSDNPNELRNLLDTFADHLAALQLLELPVEKWDIILVQMILKRVDISVATKFELHHNSSSMPSYDDLVEFLSQHCLALDNISSTRKIKSPKKIEFPKSSTQSKPSQQAKPSWSLFAKATASNCILCKSTQHTIYKCPNFAEKSPNERFQIVKENRFCLNCLSNSHSIKQCKSTYTCHKCQQKHHTMLHFDRTDNEYHPIGASPTGVEVNSALASISPLTTPPNIVSQSLTGILPQTGKILLSTAVVEILDTRGNFQSIRILLDSGSQSNFISQKCVNRLGLSGYHLNFSIQGIGNSPTISSSQGVSCQIRPLRKPSPTFDLDAIVIPRICGDLPTSPLSSRSWSHVQHLQLADPQFNSPGPIDLLLGADLFPHILQPGRLVGGPEEPVALNTVFGFVLMGKVCSPSSAPHSLSFFCCESSLENTLQKFWKVEEVPQVERLSQEDKQCESMFLDTYYRNESGRFVVSLPFRSGEPDFPDSRKIALNRFLALERRLVKNSELHKSYSAFMKEYLELGHMEMVADNTHSDKTYYVPHHAIWKSTGTSSKLRVVFNASARSPGRPSLNESLFTGPKLQSDIASILLRFRLHKYVFTTDIIQMYRQILINPRQTDFQRILWRFSPSDPIKTYRLLTVTYGFSCAPYLALKTLITLANDEAVNYPDAAQAITSHTYVDDIVTGASTLPDAHSLRNQLIELLQQGGFELRKWASNNPQLLSDIPSEHWSDETRSLNLDPDNPLKILGLQWNPSSDSFSFAVQPIDTTCTKRNLLSNLARIFDPLGILSPITFYVKFLIQKLWILRLDWDALPPPEIVRFWEQYISELPSLFRLKIPRLLMPDDFQVCELHGFCDSSEKGYCAVLYFVFLSPSNEFSSHLICAKSKVAPLKSISIAKLELCAAVLLSRLLSFTRDLFSSKIRINKVFAWSDSTIVLSWLASPPHRWKTFVSNRVSFIQEIIPSSSWFHVSSADNAADVGSRGLLPAALLESRLWWAGPSFLKAPVRNWSPFSPNNLSTEALNEERVLSMAASAISTPLLDGLLENYSSLPRLQRILAVMLRFINNCRSPRQRLSGWLLSTELQSALMILVKHTQSSYFADDIARISQGKLPSRRLQKLTPFLDNQGILRVGGRLAHAPIPYDRRFPALLPNSGCFTTLLIEYTHLKSLHAGIQTVGFLIAQQFWILSSKRCIRRIIARCLRCWRLKPTTLQPQMGNLPLDRLTQVKPFLHVGVDYAGPFSITLSKTRGAKTTKAYICLFICFSTKALHLELASDLTSDAFLAALRRFMGRRGRCERIYSDCGTNFVGAYRQLSKFSQFAASQEAIDWSFNPPSAPHFGGLWEAGVKSVKTHLSRVVGLQVLSYEELNTLLIQIEAVLNSRPITPLSNDPHDLLALTPGHFLTMAPLTAPPEPDLTNVPSNRLRRWELVQRMNWSFWVRWSQEYLHTLHQRSKWAKNDTSITPGTLVLIKNETAPPLCWRLARVTDVHPGSDGVVRVVTVRTTAGLFKRPVVKLCPLPIEN